MSGPERYDDKEEMIDPPAACRFAEQNMKATGP